MQKSHEELKSPFSDDRYNEDDDKKDIPIQIISYRSGNTDLIDEINDFDNEGYDQ